MSNSQRSLVAMSASLAALFLLPVLAHAQADAIRALVSEEYDRAESARDVAAKMQLYAADAILMPPGEAAVVGKDAIRAWTEPRYERETFEGTSTVEEIQVFGEWGFARGHWSGVGAPTAGGESSRRSGEYLVIVRQQADGTWRIAREMWTTTRANE